MKLADALKASVQGWISSARTKYETLDSKQKFGVRLAITVAIAALAFGLLVRKSHAAEIKFLVAEKGDVSLRIYKTPCTDKASQKFIGSEIKPEFNTPMSKWHRAEGLTGIRHWHACWRSVEGGALVVAEDGSVGLVPPAAFHLPKPKGTPKQDPNMI